MAGVFALLSFLVRFSSFKDCSQKTWRHRLLRKKFLDLTVAPLHIPEWYPTSITGHLYGIHLLTEFGGHCLHSHVALGFLPLKPNAWVMHTCSMISCSSSSILDQALLWAFRSLFSNRVILLAFSSSSGCCNALFGQVSLKALWPLVDLVSSGRMTWLVLLL